MALEIKTTAATKVAGVATVESPLTVPAGTVVVFTAMVTPTPTTDPVPDTLALYAGDSATGATLKKGATVNDVTTYSAEYTPTADSEYQARDGANAAAAGDTSVTIKVTPVTPAPATDPLDDLKNGLFDKGFTARTGAVALLLALVVVVLTARGVAAVELPARTAVLTDTEIPFGTFPERVAAIVAISALGLGALVLIVGAWMGLLETRGRLKLVPATTVEVPNAEHVGIMDLGTPAGALKDILTSGGALMDSFKGMRATAAALFCGAVVVLAALWSVTSVADNSTPTPTTTTTPVVASVGGAATDIPTAGDNSATTTTTR